ncbi:hypothetical protein [Lysobacter solisilvae (ex Woo and Kim 2020)]|uniref:Uncharacterized protein n=1 Tax=Agrilutibacter terrestris TaxID=2865112 RepID=A0A7H0G0X0_9GAMM|nr:hypothetical protein [Lysobacter terrestris]QNP41936.1 hypothetical protein H8B22_07010 [Lysobacter terrestris]
MNTRLAEVHTSQPSNPAAAAVAALGAAQAAPRHVHRERDFGVGYGNSSGYGRDRRYTSNGFAPLFRCA